MTVGLACLALLLPACGSDEDATPTEEACQGWRDLLTAEPAPSDAEVQTRLGELLELGPEEPVAGYMVAMRARLRDGVDISTTYQRLSEACT